MHRDRLNVFESIRTRVIVIHNEHILMKYPSKPDPNRGPYRVLPGGGLEPKESLFECGNREVMEESGIEVACRSIAFIREWIIPKYARLDTRFKVHLRGEEVAYGLEVFLRAIVVNPARATPQDTGETHGVAVWIPLKDIAGMPLFPPELREYVRLSLEGRSMAGVPSFISNMGHPSDRAEEGCFDIFLD